MAKAGARAGKAPGESSRASAAKACRCVAGARRGAAATRSGAGIAPYLSRQARLRPLPRAEGPAGGRRGRPLLRAEARCAPPALRSAARARRGAEELGGHARAEPCRGEKRLAVHTEDHPLEYLTFEGVIPQGEYGGGTMIVWDEGRWAPEGDPRAGYKKGHLAFALDGRRLKGRWHLVRTRPKPREKKEQWLLLKADDGFARPPGEPRDHGRGDDLGALRADERRACGRRRSPGRSRRARQSRKRAQARAA